MASFLTSSNNSNSSNSSSSKTKTTDKLIKQLLSLLQKTQADIKIIKDRVGPIVIPPPPPPPPPDPDNNNHNLDADGVPLMSTPKPNGERNWYLRPESLGTLPPINNDNRIDPPGDPQLSLEVQTVQIQTLPGTTNKKFLHTTSTTANERCSIHIASHDRSDDDEENIKYCWNTGAQDKHYMVHEDDVRAAEYTLIFKITGIQDNLNEEVSWILMGAGHHTSPSTNNQASCHNNHFKYNGSGNGKNAFSVEFNHGTYERVDATPQTMYTSMEGKVFGVKVCTMPTPDFSARHTITYVNTDPIDLSTGKPKLTGWKKYTERTQTDYLGKHNPHTWGGAKDKVRCDHIKEMDFYYASRVEIIGLSPG